MFKALDGRDNLVSANKINKSNIINTKFKCPCCKEEVHYVKESVGLKRAHFAHNSSKNPNICDIVYDKDYKTEWHIDMQNIFDENLQETIIEENGKRKIADVKDGNKIVEFQHSPITTEEFIERTKMYSKNNILIWVFDMKNKITKPKKYYKLIYERDTKKFVTIQKPIDVDTNDSLLCFRNLSIGEEDNLICYFYLIFQINDDDFLLVNFCNGKGYYNGKILKYNQFKNFITNEKLHFEPQKYIDRNEICVDHKFEIDENETSKRVDERKCYDVDFEGRCKKCRCIRIYKVEEAHCDMQYNLKEEPTCIKKGSIYNYCFACGKKELVEKLEIEKDKHKFPKYPKMVARSTCIKKGIEEKECEICGYKIQKELPLSTLHEPGDFEIIQEPTCLKEGLKEQKCKTCGYIINSESIPPFGHTPEKITIPSTCTKQGCVIEKCNICNEIISNIKKMKKPHNQLDKKEISAPTCLEEGKYKAYCDMCKKEIIHSTPKEKHNFKWAEAGPYFHQEICKNCKTIREYSMEGHDFDPKTGICKKCAYNKRNK